MIICAYNVTSDIDLEKRHYSEFFIDTNQIILVTRQEAQPLTLEIKTFDWSFSLTFSQVQDMNYFCELLLSDLFFTLKERKFLNKEKNIFNPKAKNKLKKIKG